MNDYDFTVEGTYEGDWKFPMCNDTVYGTLIIEKELITLRVLIPKGFPWKCHTNIDVKGKAFRRKITKRLKNLEFHFLLQNLRVLQFGNSSSTYNEITFDVQEAFISIEPDINFSAINSCIIRTELLDKWCWEHIGSSYIHNSIDAGAEQDLVYKQKEPYTCFQDKEGKIVLYFGTQTIHPSVNGFHIMNKCFLNILFNEKQDFEYANIFAERVWHLFPLLWNVAYEPDYIEFKTTDNRFIYIQNGAKCEHRSRDAEYVLFSELQDFTQQDLEVVIKEWIVLYENKPEAIRLYVETALNERLSSKNIIKNLVSVIDGLTENVETEGISKSPAKVRKINELLNKCDQLSKNERNEIITGYLRESGSELKPRFRKVLLEMKEYPPYRYIIEVLSKKKEKSVEDIKEDEVIYDFVDCIVDTRNYLTHPKTPKCNLIPSELYSEHAYVLQKILQVYLLQKIKVSSDVISKVCQMFP